MDVTESLNEGLRREYKVVIDAAQMTSRIDARLLELKKSTHIKGFRPGKVPMELLRRMHGDGVVKEVLRDAIRESSNDALSQRKFRQALPATVRDVSFSQGENLEYVLAVEVMPEIEPFDPSGLVLSVPVVEVSERDIVEVFDTLAHAAGKVEVLDNATPVMLEDRITADIEVLVDGERSDELSAAGQEIFLTEGSLAPRLLDAVMGLTTGNRVEVESPLPDAEEEGGSPALFRISLLKAERLVPHAVDASLAEHYGCDDLDGLREEAQTALEELFARLARDYTKRRLIDHLNESCDFEVPPGLVESEFRSVWKQVEPTLKRRDMDEEALARERSDCRALAERRVRAALLMARIAGDVGIRVDQTDLQTILVQQTARHPGREAEVVRHFQEHPEDLRQFAAPIVEDRVIDHILESAACDRETMDVRTFLDLDNDEDGVKATHAREHYMRVAGRVIRNLGERLKVSDAADAGDAEAAEGVEGASR